MMKLYLDKVIEYKYDCGKNRINNLNMLANEAESNGHKKHCIILFRQVRHIIAMLQ